MPDKPITALPVYDIFGRKIDISMSGMRFTFFSMQFVLFLILLISLLVILDTFDFRAVMPIWASAVFWTVFVVSLVLLDAVILTAAIFIRKKIKNLIVVFPVVGALSMVANTFATNFLISLLTNDPFDISTGFNNLGINLFIGFVIETLYFSFVRGPIQKQFLARHSARRTSISIGKEVFNLSKITVLHAKDHYIEVVTANNNYLIRARLADVVTQLEDADGIMPHRSHWVATTTIESVIITPEGSKIVLTDGAKVPIAQGRKVDVQDWSERNGIVVQAS